jgi:GR25 family glycosyltransferase involved in LPS biosynthesis
MGRAPIAIVLSHLSVLQDAYDSGFNTIWVMEDDIQVVKDPHLLSTRIDQLNFLAGNRWDILFTDPDTKNSKGEYVPCLGYALRPNYTPTNPGRFAERIQMGPNFKKIGARYGAYSMIIKRSGMKKILDFIKNHQIFLPYDMDFYLPEGIVMYSVTEDIVSTLPQALSDNNH